MVHINTNKQIGQNNFAPTEITVNTQNQDNNTIWAAYNDSNDIIDIDDIKYTKEGDESLEISNFLSTNKGKRWTEELKNQFNKLIENYNYVKNIRAPWQEYSAQAPMKLEDNEPSPVYSPENSEPEKTKSEDEIKTKIVNLAPGEKFSYKESSFGLGFTSTNTVVVERQEDGTLVESRAGVLSRISYPHRKAIRLQTVYNEDYSQKIAEEFVDPQKNQWGVVSTKHYNEKGESAYVTTNLQNLDSHQTPFRIIIALQNCSKSTYQKQVLYDNEGKVIFEVRNGIFYNAKGKEVAEDKIWDKLNDAIEDGNLGILRQEYKI